MKVIIEIAYKDNIFDAIGEGVKKDIADLGMSSASNIKFSQLYRIDGALKKDKLNFICNDILSDSITQRFLFAGGKKKSDGSHFIEVWYKKGVTDAVGESVKKAIEDVGIKGIKSVMTGKKYSFDGHLAERELKEIAAKLLANTLVEDYYIDENPHQ